MGQKVNPVSLRLPLTKDWKALWYAPKNIYTKYLIQDIQIRKLINEKMGQSAGIDQIKIQRSSGEVKIFIHTSKPGLFIGRQGQGIIELKKWLKRKIGPDLNSKTKINLEIVEYKKPELSASIVAENIGYQISKRMYYKRAIKQAISKTMMAGAKGIKIQASGRLAGSEIARKEKFSEGPIPTSTLRAKIDFAVYHAQTNSGTVGIKVWIYR
jgi:small subunit ribosomal protein S3